ncbi:NHS-like protein 1 isoform X2 [Hippocampus zosterae]|uniref:NHS-like protein 1 isoform X2 n=1 Tax=Hippocampus zosterae TaxID=109293 RepID=UPI00223CE3E5|nr:NHS-like protein 1 isoform X2 [Hippocampus zosterae]
MISYVECLGRDVAAGNSVASQCWNSEPDEEQDQLLPRKMVPLQPKTEGSLRRRLLTAKIHQHQEAIWGRNAGMAGWPPTGHQKPLPPQPQYPKPCDDHHRSPHDRIYASVPPEAHGKTSFAEIHRKQPAQSHQVPRPALPQWRRTSSCPPTPEPRRGYVPPDPSPLKVRELEVPPQYGYRPGKKRKSKFFGFKKRQRREATPLLCKAEDCDRWSIRYTPQTPQQGLLFIPAKGPQASDAEDLQAFCKVTQHGDSNPTTSLLGTPSPTSYTSPGLRQSEGKVHRRWRDKSRKMSSASSDEEETVILNNTRPLTPLILNPIDLTSCWDVFGYETDLGVKAEPNPRLPTPEERMRQQADAVTTEVVPINITGQSFDRQASFRKVACNLDSSSCRRRNPNHRVTVPVNHVGVVNRQDTDSPADQCSTASPLGQREEEDLVLRKRESLARKIRAPRGEGPASLMMSLTSPRVDSLSCSSNVRSLPRMATSSSLDSDASCNSVSYRTLSASSSGSQDFSPDLQPLIPCGVSLRAGPQCPSPSPLSAHSCSRKWGRTCSSDLGINCDESPNCSHYRSSSTSIADPESLDGGSIPSRCVSHGSLKPTCRTGGNWSPINQETSPVPAVSSACSSSSNFVSVYSEDVMTLSSWQSRTSLSSTSSSCRSISLRKSKRPPPPPLRTDSLRRRNSRNKSCHSSSSPAVESSPGSSAQVLDDPWVPRDHNTQRQSKLDSGTVVNFETWSVDQHAASTDNTPSTSGRNLGLSYYSLVSKEEGQLQHLTSPSSGYSSQSSTPVTGTSPGASSLSQNSPFVYPSVNSLPPSPKKSKPLPPDRRSSLLSSSFSSSSSLSSCSSSNSSAQRTHPPPPRPLPLQLSPLQPTPQPPSSLPPPPPLPPSLQPTPHLQLSSPPLRPSSFHPSPLPPCGLLPHPSLSPAPSLSPSSLPLWPIHLSPSSLPLQQSSLHPSPPPHTSLPPPPPPPPPLPSSNLPLQRAPTKPSPGHPAPLPSSPLPPHPSHFSPSSLYPPTPLPSSLPLQPPHLLPSSVPPPAPLQPSSLHPSRLPTSSLPPDCPHLKSSPLPSPPPLPPSSLPHDLPRRPPSYLPTPLSASYLPPPSSPPCPSSLLPSSIPLSPRPLSVPPPLPPPSASRPPPPPYSHAVKQSSHHAALISMSPDVVEPPGFDRPPNRGVNGFNLFAPPLVTAQALRSVKLRSITNREVLAPDNVIADAKFSDTPRRDVAPSLHTPARVDSKQPQPEILPRCEAVSKDTSVYTHDQPINGQIDSEDPQMDARLVNNRLREGSCLKPSDGTPTQVLSEAKLTKWSYGTQHDNHRVSGDFARHPLEIASLKKKPILPKKPTLSILGVRASPEPKGDCGSASIASDLVNPQCFPETMNSTGCVGGHTGNKLHGDTSSSDKGCHPSSTTGVRSSFDGSAAGPRWAFETLTRSSLAVQIGTGTSLQQPVDRQYHRKMMRSLGEDGQEETSTLMFAVARNDKPRKKRRPTGRRLLIMAPNRVSSSSSSSSSTSSDEEAEAETKESSFCAAVGLRSCSLSRVLSGDNLQGALSLTDLLVEEDKEEEVAARKIDPDRRSEAGFLTGESARPRTTEDLFAVIHRSKRKMFGRRDSSGLTSADHRPRPRPQSLVSLKGKRPSKSESFKTLLLRKGSHLQSSSQMSAAERLRVAAAPATSVQATCLCSANTDATLDVSQTYQNVSAPWALRQRASRWPLFSSPVFVPSSLATQPRPHTGPRSAGRRWPVRHRHFAGRMTAIYEREGEEE